jgi:formylglycine-generating enzyme required for sulfatase activity
MSEPSLSRGLEPVNTALYSQYRNLGRWAVIVGISKYQYSNLNLKYADRDAEDLYQLLLTPKGGGFQPDHIFKLTNEQATTAEINRALRSFLKKPAREDLVLIYFACHGAPDPDRPSTVYLLTHDTDPNDIAATALPMEDIDRALKGILHSEKVIILADTCHSAAIGGGIGRRSVDDSMMNQFLQQMSQSKGGVALLTSAEANEVSFEDPQWGDGHGVFTHYLLEGMRGAADRDDNGIVTVGELFEYVRDQVQRATDYRQHPSIGTNAYDRNMPIAISDETRFIASSTSIETPVRTRASSQAQSFKFETATVIVKALVSGESSIEINRRNGTAEFFAEKLDEHTVLEMVSIPGGNFIMGSPDSEEEQQDEEGPQHMVRVPSFWMGRYAVTQSQWFAVATDLPKINIELEPDPSYSKGLHRPVERVSWYAAVEFCNRLSQKTGKPYRLPSEAEWEYACRARTTTPFHFGETITPDLVNYDGNYTYGAGSKGVCREQTTEVGSFLPNAFGLYDLHGNVWEWCADHWHENYQGAPVDGSAWITDDEASGRLLRGGSWGFNPRYCRSAYRNRSVPDDRYDVIGFRVVFSAAWTP